MEWFWASFGGVVVVLLVFGVVYDRRANRLGRKQLDPKEPSRDKGPDDGQWWGDAGA